MNDMKNHLDIVNSLTPAARTASANGAAVDLRGFHAAVICLVIGTLTDGTHTPSVEESDNGADFTAVAAADLEGAFVAATTLVNQRVGYKGNKRYVRGVITVAGGPATGAVAAMSVIRGHAHREPVA